MNKAIMLMLAFWTMIQVQAQREYVPTTEDLERFHQSKTYVVLETNPLSDYNIEIQDAVRQFWKITPFEFIHMDQFAEKSYDTNASFLYLAAVSFEKDRTNARYKFLCLSMGGDHISLDELKDIANIPLSYYGVDNDFFSYKLGIMVRFLQDHIRLITEKPEVISRDVYKYYNENIAGIRGKTLYLVEDEVAREVGTLARIRKIYPNPVELVDRDRIKELIVNEDQQAVILHKVGPEGKKMNARVYKILIGAADARFYYFDHHKASEKKPDAFLESDFKKLAKGLN